MRVLASTVAIIVQTVALQIALARRLPGMGFGGLWLTLGKVLLATLAMGVAVAGGWAVVRHEMGGARVADSVAIGALIPLGAVVYAAVLWWLRVEGREEFSALAAKVAGKFRKDR